MVDEFLFLAIPIYGQDLTLINLRFWTFGIASFTLLVNYTNTTINGIKCNNTFPFTFDSQSLTHSKSINP